jgi:hypothetical protein
LLLRHATPKRNLPSIERLGLLTSKSQGKLPVVWRPRVPPGGQGGTRKYWGGNQKPKR